MSSKVSWVSPTVKNMYSLFFPETRIEDDINIYQMNEC